MTEPDSDTDPTLDLLNAYFSAPDLGDAVMTLAELDGFLTALAIGPAAVAPAEWLPVIWNGAEPRFADDAQAQAVLGAISTRLNDILQSIDADADAYGPLLEIDDEGDPLPQSWADGFMTAASLRIEAWTKLFESEEDDAIAYPILALCDGEDGNSLFDLSARDRAFLVANAPEMIGQAVVDIAAYWKRDAVPRVPIRTGPKIGRNDPCPCGSGKKHKKCCGA
ncbi:MAG TPA: UPF0149 family protein [Rhizomicrobium sp.]|jgi:uncharacterized protein|nr:UPF0149 family protein [Rhizomicrobium sp.]